MTLRALVLALLATGAAAQPAGPARPVDRPTLHVVAVGIEAYPGRVEALPGATWDAASVSSAFEDIGDGFFRAVVPRILINDDATRDGLRTAIDDVASRAEAEDTVVLYLRGRAATVRGVGALITADAGGAGVPFAALAGWLDALAARRLLVVADLAATPAATAALLEALEPDDDDGRSRTVLAPEGPRPEDPTGASPWGPMATALLGALAGTADADRDAVVSAHELTGDAVERRLRALAPGARLGVVRSGPDFPLGRSRVLGPDGAFRFEAPSLTAHPAELLVEAALATAPARGPGFADALLRAVRSMATEPRLVGATRRQSVVAALAPVVADPTRRTGWSARDDDAWTEAEAYGVAAAFLATVADGPDALRAAARAGAEGPGDVARGLAGVLDKYPGLGPEAAPALAALGTPLPAPEAGRLALPLEPVVGAGTLALVGRAEGPRRAVAVTVDGAPVELAPSGAFALARPMGPLRETVRVRATDAAGRVVERAVTVAPAMRGTDEEEPEAPPLPPRRDLALFFATDDYADSRLAPLRNPIADAVAVARELHDRHGFDTLVVRNPTRKAIERTLYEYRALAVDEAADSQLFVFVAGHGRYIEAYREGFIQAADAQAEDVTSYLSMNSLAGQLDRMVNFDRILLVLDVCYGGSVFEASRGDDAYPEASPDEILRGLAGSRSRLALTSGGVERVADGVPGEHSPFAARLLSALRTDADGDGLLFFGDLVASARKVAGQKPQAGTFGVHGDRGSLTFVFVEQDEADAE